MREYQTVYFYHRKTKPVGYGAPEPLCESSWPVDATFTKGDVVQFQDEDNIKQYRVNDVIHKMWSQGGFGGYKLSVILVSE